jgi:hypothetical protein
MPAAGSTIAVTRFQTDVKTALVPITFITASGGSYNYSDEGKWNRTPFVHKSKLVIPIGGEKFKLQPSVPGNDIRENFYKDTELDFGHFRTADRLGVAGHSSVTLFKMPLSMAAR